MLNNSNICYAIDIFLLVFNHLYSSEHPRNAMDFNQVLRIRAYIWNTICKFPTQWLKNTVFPNLGEYPSSSILQIQTYKYHHLQKKLNTLLSYLYAGIPNYNLWSQLSHWLKLLQLKHIQFKSLFCGSFLCMRICVGMYQNRRGLIAHLWGTVS